MGVPVKVGLRPDMIGTGTGTATAILTVSDNTK